MRSGESLKSSFKSLLHHSGVKLPQTGWLLIPLLLLAFALRTHRLGAQSLWYDEGVTAYLTTLSLPELTRWTAEDIQPPLYYYILFLWVRVAGRSEFALRFPSLFFGILMVPLFWLLGRTLVGGKTALIGALLATVSPLYLWYSQEARMYTLFAFLCLLSCYLLLRSTRPPENQGIWPSSSGSWVRMGYLAANALALYTHYFAFFLLAFQALFAIVDGLRRGIRRRRFYGTINILLLQGMAALLYAPWLPFLLKRYQVDVSYWKGTLKLHEALRKILISFSTGETMLEQDAIPIAIAYGVMFLAGMALLLATRRHRSVLFLGLYLGVPLVAVLALTYRSPKFNPRYLMFASPAFLLGIAGGMGTLGEFRPRFVTHLLLAGTLAFIAITTLQADHNLYYDPAFTKADFRAVARYIRNHRSPGETVLLVSGHMYPVFAYYYGPVGWTPIPPLRIISTEKVVGFDVARSLNRALQGKKGVWVVLWQDEVVDPNGVVLKLLDQNCEPVPVEASFWHIGLRHYRIPPGVQFPPHPRIQHPVQVNFGGLIKFLGYDLSDETLTLYWQALQPLEEDYKVTVNILDKAGHLWGQADRRPAAYLYPTTRWRVGEITFGEMELPLMPGTPPGKYRLYIGLYSGQDPQGLDILDEQGAPQGKRAFVGEIQVSRLRIPRPGESYPIALKPALPLTPEISIRGVRLAPTRLRPGDILHLTLLWEASVPPQVDYELRLQLVDSRGNLVERTYPPAGRDFPTHHWPPGKIILGQYALRIPPSTQGGKARLFALLEEPTGTAGEPVLLGELEVEPVERSFEPPTPDVELRANFAGLAELLGIDVAKDAIEPGAELPVILYWQPRRETEKSYTVFVHLLDGQGRLLAQHDGLPAGGQRPTTGWLPGEIISDRHLLSLPGELPPGPYIIEIGLYDAGEPGMPRLPVLNGKGLPSDDRVTIQLP